MISRWRLLIEQLLSAYTQPQCMGFLETQNEIHNSILKLIDQTNQNGGKLRQVSMNTNLTQF